MPWCGQGEAAGQRAARALANGAAGLVLEGDFSDQSRRNLRDAALTKKLPVIEMGRRSDMRLGSGDPILATGQGVWPGIRLEEDGKIHAAPSGGPWIDTNAGFLAYAQAVGNSMLWLGNRPPDGAAVTPERYIQAAADARVCGARWVLALDDDFAARLLKRDAKALAGWAKISRYLSFYEQHREWASWKPAGELAIVEDPETGALLSGGIVDMVVVKHTPVRAVPTADLTGNSLEGAKTAVVVDPSSLSQQRQETLQAFRRRGGTTLSGPPDWKFPAPRPGQMTLGDAEVKKIEQIWKEVNSLIYHQNLGVRLFNVPTVLTQLLEPPDGSQRLLQMVNYSDYPLESVTVYVRGKYKKARLITPEAGEKAVPVYDIDEGTGVDIDRIGLVAALIVE